MLQRFTRRYSNVFSFIPNEDKHIFEGEKLTAEENDAAVPERAPRTHKSKIIHEITSPQKVADLFIKATSKDILVTSLAHDSPLMADRSIKWISKDSRPISTNLQFANITSIWFKKFNQDIKALEEIPVDTKKTLHAKIITERLQNAWTGSFDSLDEFFTSQNAFETKRFNALQSVVPDFSKIALFLVSQLKGTADLKALLDYVNSKLPHFTPEGLRDFTVALANYVSGSKESSQVFSDFYGRAKISPDQMSPQQLDSLAGVLIDGGNLNSALDVVAKIVALSKCPSVGNLNKLLAEYDIQRVDYTPEETIRDLSFLKPVLFHIEWTPTVFEFFLRNCVRNVVEFEHFVRLAGDENVQKYQTELLSKLNEIGGDDTALVAAQFMRSIKSISRETKEVARTIFPENIQVE